MSHLKDNWLALVCLACLVLLVMVDKLAADAVVTFIVGLGITAPAVEGVKTKIQGGADG